MTLYTAQANIGSQSLDIRKGDSISQEVYEALPGNLKIKFIAAVQSSEPKGKNEIVGDSPAEKLKREKLQKEDELKKKSNKRNKDQGGK